MRYIDACAAGSWHLMLSDIADDGEVLPPSPFKWTCRSWRHDGPCRQLRGAIDFNRISAAIEKLESWVYVVLTFSQSEWWDWKEQYILSCTYWSALRLRMRRRYGKVPYIQTWERHLEDGIHVNILLSSAMFKEECYRALKKPFKKTRWFNDWLEKNAAEVGFGWVHWAEPMRQGSSEGMAGYLTKLAKELVGGGVKGQIPWDAPAHFRRLRATRGLLPPFDPSSMTGRMVFSPFPEGVEADGQLLDEYARKLRGEITS